MIRILIDERGDGHSDIFLKVDALPSFLHVADLYFMADFLKLDPDKIDRVPQDLGIAYVNYLKTQLANLDDREKFIVFDLSDQYIGGLLVTKKKKGLLQINYGTTQKLSGFSIDIDSLNETLNETIPEFRRERDWLLSYDSIIENLNWSIDKINR
jgi:hypothetical protein